MPNNGYFDTVFAYAGDVTAVPDASPGDGSVSYATGYGIAYSTPVASGGLNFPRGQHNQVLKDITSAIKFIQENGASNFITTAMNGGVSPFSYTLGAVVAYDAGGGLQNWLSTAAANTTVPGAVGAKWIPLKTASVFTGGTSTGTANAQAVATIQGNFTNTAGNIVTWKAGYSTTAASTLAVDSASAATVKVMARSGLRDTGAGDIVVGGEYLGISDGTYIQLLNPSGALQATSNLSDLASVSTALSNLGFVDGLNSGYAQVPCGTRKLLVQSGTASVGSNSFPLAFPNACRGVVAIMNSGNIPGGTPCEVAVTFNTTTFTPFIQNVASATIYWIAIGY